MHVEIDLERLKHPGSGLGQVCYNFLNQLALRTDLQITAFAPKCCLLPQVSHISHHSTKLLHNFLSINTSDVNVWHCTHQGSRYWPADPKIPVVLTIHDLNFLTEKRSPLKLWRYMRGLQKKIDNSTIITAISEFTKSQVEEHMKLGSKKIIVIPNGAEPSLTHEETEVAALKGVNFLFALGVMAAKKNFPVLIPMMEHLPDLHLVIAGGPQNFVYNDLLDLAQNSGYSHRIHFLGYIDAPTRNWLYKNSQAVLVPSLLEGFGLPVAEALFFGRPVVCSNKTSLPEVGGELAVYWEDYNAQTMAQKVRMALAQYQQSPEIFRVKCQSWTKNFQWSQVIDKYIQVYKAVATKK